MKKILFFMSLIAAMATLTTSCSKDDDDRESLLQRKLKFVNALTQNSTSCAWEGLQTEQHKSWGSWSDHATKYFIMRFDRSTKEAIEEVYIDVLVDVIDRHVERCENYEQRVKEFYHL